MLVLQETLGLLVQLVSLVLQVRRAQWEVQACQDHQVLLGILDQLAQRVPWELQVLLVLLALLAV
jgi:Na+/H+ antiporter NhaA